MRNQLDKIHGGRGAVLIRDAALISLLAASTALAAAPPGWAMNWTDDFNGTSIDSARWERLNRRDSYNNEKQYYMPAQVTVGNGNLRLTATNQPIDGKQYRSGLVRTWQEQTYGRWEIRGSLPTTQGMWPAIWLLPRNVDWPIGGEIDIMENRGSQPNLVSSAYHYGPSVAGHQYVFDEFTNTVDGSPMRFHGNMHTYAVEWDPTRIRYFVDGVPHFTFYQGTAPISSSPMSLIINLAVGGDFGGDPNGSTVFPQHFDVDSVNVYNRNAATRAISNGGFESVSGEYLTDWDEYSNGGNVRKDAVAANARTGTSAVQMYGRFDGAASNNSGVFQEVPTTAGEVWQVSAFARNRPGDVLTGNNSAGIKIEFIDANGALINLSELKVLDGSSPTAYRESVVRRTAPVGAVFARAVLEMVQRNNANGAANFDDAALRRVTASSLAGDINLDGTADAADLDALLHSLSAVNTHFNFNGDGTVNQADVDRLLADAFNTTRGDVNLDQSVDFDDLLIVAQSYGVTGSGGWATGDFSGEGSVNFDDLLSLAQYYDSAELASAAGLSSAEAFEADWQLARSLVPEPMALTMLVAPILLMRRTRTDARHSKRNGTDIEMDR